MIHMADNVRYGKDRTEEQIPINEKESQSYSGDAWDWWTDTTPTHPKPNNNYLETMDSDDLRQGKE